MRAGLVAVALLLAGCAAPTQAPPPAGPTLAFGEPVRVLGGDEVRCYEPFLAARPDGLLAVVTACGTTYAVSRDGGATWGRAPLPPPPGGPALGWTPCDNVLQFDDGGRLFYTSIIVPGGPAPLATRSLAGLQLARSDDGGATWPVNHHLDLLAGPSGAVVADRPWLAVRGDELALAYFQVGVGIQVARSGDAGATFSPFARAVPHEERRFVAPGGPLAFGPDGTLAFPYFAAAPPGAPEAAEVRVARSPDAGATWATERVGPAATPDIPFWPVLARAPGRDVVAWSDASGALLLASSEGGPWTDAERWNPPGDHAWSPPWLDPREGATELFWYAQGAQGYTPTLSRGPAAGQGPVVRFPALPPDAFPSDFAHAARHAGRTLVAWAHAEEGVFVAVER